MQDFVRPGDVVLAELERPRQGALRMPNGVAVIGQPQSATLFQPF